MISSAVQPSLKAPITVSSVTRVPQTRTVPSASTFSGGGSAAGISHSAILDLLHRHPFATHSHPVSLYHTTRLGERVGMVGGQTGDGECDQRTRPVMDAIASAERLEELCERVVEADGWEELLAER